MGINVGDVVCQVVNGDCIVDVDWFFKQDNQVGDKVGEDFLQVKFEIYIQCGDQLLQF